MHMEDLCSHCELSVRDTDADSINLSVTVSQPPNWPERDMYIRGQVVTQVAMGDSLTGEQKELLFLT